MKTRLLITVMAIARFTAALAQDVQWNREAYPDYDPVPHVDQKWVRQAEQRIKVRKAKGAVRPDHWNNADSKAFPPVVNQSSGSCGSASRIYYMFTHEINAMRDADGSVDENIYPTHFTWLLTYGNADKGVMATKIGVPNSVVYGGRTYSELFGYNEWTDTTAGWMQGYDKWFNAFNNRISGTGNFPYALNTEEGRELVKNYLWNHCGDERFATGGIVGVGVAAGCTTGKIPTTAKNRENGTAGMNYVKYWGESVDHALTIVGYDDRIEFDLDGNGISGEESNSTGQNENGAWIIVNSWGAWMNNGFIYCPYAEARPTRTTTGYWQPEYYTARWGYRPLRTIKLLMDYNRRSELKLWVGVAQDTAATSPEASMALEHFQYAGDGHSGNLTPAPLVPMLGRWADGDMHEEPMEFGYDLTDLTSTFDLTRPLKYFFWVETKGSAIGTGHIYKASIIDYKLDRDGIETPFSLTDGGTIVQSGGKKTQITAIVHSEAVAAPRNLTFSGTTLAWQRPAGSGNPVTYNIYQNGTLAQQVAADQLSSATSGSGTFAVSAVYEINGNDVESEKSAPVIADEGQFTEDNDILYLTRPNSGFTLPAVTSSSLNAWTLEFWVRPNSAFPRTGDSGDCFGIKASSGKFFFKVNSGKKIEVGFDGGDYYKEGAATITGSKWTHIAIVEDGQQIKVYANGRVVIDFRSSYNNSGLSGANDLVFGASEGTTCLNKQRTSAPWEGYIDELRFWNVARSQSEIRATFQQAYTYPMMQSHLTHYYQMNVNADSTALVSAIGGADIDLSTPETMQPKFTNSEVNKSLNFLVATASADFLPSSKEVLVGEPVTITDLSAPSTYRWNWTFTGAEHESLAVNQPVVVFNQPGEQTIHLTTTSIGGATAEQTGTIKVSAASAPVADFQMSTSTAVAGEHVSFINKSTPQSVCTYQWTFEEAETSGATTANAAATFNTTGTHRVTLVATNAQGSSTCTKTIEVSKVKPQPAFNIRNNIAILGEKIYLVDATKYEPEQWIWSVSSDAYTLAMKGKEGSLEIDRPGIYSVSLTATNEIGSATTTRSKAITVCTADGGNGLSMGGSNDSGSSNSNNTVEATSPFSTARTRATIAFWLYPTNLINGGNGIGSDPTSLLLTTNADGSMNFQTANKTGKSSAGYVIANEWHHYAVTYSSGTVTFYRDGQQISTATGIGTSIRKQEFLRIGGPDYPFNGIIDELQVWSSALTLAKVREYASSPIEEPTSATGLLLYYQFNQTSGDVIDASGHGLTGVRTNFGPDGDAWTSTKGIFFLNFANTSTDITSNKLKNYKAPFTTASGFVNGTTRFKRLATGTTASPWVIENAATNGSVTTCWHVDANKSNYLTLSTTWDSFAGSVSNLKLYQTVSLEPGAYELSVSSDKEFNTSGNFLVAAAGNALPDYADLGSAMAYAQANKPINFVVTEAGDITLGIISNQSGQTCMTIQAFKLTRKEFDSIDADGETAITVPLSDTADDHTYDLSGRRISKPAMGIVIRNGRKIVVR